MTAAQRYDSDKRQPVPLAEQAEAAHRALAMVYRSCEAKVRRGEMSRAEADREISAFRAMRDTLALFAEFEDAVRHTVRNELARVKFVAELETLRDEPAVAAVLDAIPGAEITDVREFGAADLRPAKAPDDRGAPAAPDHAAPIDRARRDRGSAAPSKEEAA